MMKIKIISAIYLTVALMTLVSCGSSHGDTSIPLPEYISEITLDEDNNVTDQLQTETIIIMDQYAYILMTATQIPLIVTKVRLVWREDVVASYMAERSITLTEMIM